MGPRTTPTGDLAAGAGHHGGVVEMVGIEWSFLWLVARCALMPLIALYVRFASGLETAPGRVT